MWIQLWDDFDNRAERLVAGGPIADAIDQTIMWQLQGHSQFVGAPIPPNALQLPELYSGRPWQDPKRLWIAFITVNPSISAVEVFPTRAGRQLYGNDLEAFFDERFEPGPIMDPIIHGRKGENLAVWWNPDHPVPHGQSTWTRIDNAVTACFALADPPRPIPIAPLGQFAAIIDIVPWKFRNWSAVHPNVKVALLEGGAPYLNSTLEEHTPAVIVAAGQSVREAMHTLQPQVDGMPPSGVPPYLAHQHQIGTFEVGEIQVPWFGVAAPTAHQFYAQMQAIAPVIMGHL